MQFDIKHADRISREIADLETAFSSVLWTLRRVSTSVRIASESAARALEEVQGQYPERVESISLPTQVANALVLSGVSTVGQLWFCSATDLLKLPNISRKRLTLIIDMLAVKGLALDGRRIESTT